MLDKISIPLFLLMLSALSIVITLIYVLRTKGRSQLKTFFCVDLICVLVICLGVMFQDILSKNFNWDPWNFEKFIYIGTCFLPVAIFFTGLIFTKTKITFKKRYLLFFIVPALSLIVLWTNDYHHLFYKHYSININEGVPGSYMIVHNIYSYSLLLLGVFQMIKATSKNSGFFSKQSLLLILGISIPLVTNILGTFKILPMTVYITPISFAHTMICFAFAIFKFQFLGIAPIAVQIIANRISDSYLVLDDYLVMSDFNETFLKTFRLHDYDIRGKDIFTFFKEHKKYKVNVKRFQNAIQKAQASNETVSFEIHIESLDKYFTIEISTLYNNDIFLGILLLFKDITQHKKDMQAIKDNQDMLMEKERLASLGQLIGGISHNLKTPIMSISGAAEGLTDLIKEYEASVGDPEVTVEDHHAIANDMKEWISKIHSYTAYMSDIITAVKGQAVALSENQNDVFTVDELLKRVDILMKHEIKNASLILEVNLEVPSDTKLEGDVNSLVQVVNNLITNAIQAYNGVKGEKIEIRVRKDSSNLIISVSDHGMGMSNEVKDKLFKSMVTTKGKNGTGLGLFMSYSTIKGHFNGEMTFESELNVGTTFNVILPLPESL